MTIRLLAALSPGLPGYGCVGSLCVTVYVWSKEMNIYRSATEDNIHIPLDDILCLSLHVGCVCVRDREKDRESIG